MFIFYRTLDISIVISCLFLVVFKSLNSNHTIRFYSHLVLGDLFAYFLL